MGEKVWWALALAVALLGVSSAGAQTDVDPDGRPILEGEQTYETTHFLIHYTLVGEDAVNPADENSDGTPDYVEQVASALEAAYDTQVEGWGWAPPPADAGKGGDDRLDVYLGQLFSVGIAGLVSPANGWIGDNPLTDAIERNAAYSYMVLDNDFAELSDFDPTYTDDDIDRYLEAVVAHEFNHMVQSGYNGFDESVWLYEGSATWAEAQSFDEPEFALNYAPYTLKNPDYCLPDNAGREQSGLRWYGSWLFFQHLTDEYGRDFMRDLWVAMGTSTGEQALRTTLSDYATTLPDETFAFAVKNVLRAYEAGEALPTVRLEAETGIGRFTPSDGVQPLGVDYIRLTTDEEIAVSIAFFEEDAPFELSLITIDDTNGTATITEASTSIEATLQPEQPAYLLVFNTEPWEDPFSCTFADYGLTVQLTDDITPTGTTTQQGITYAPPVVGDEAADPSGVLQIDRPFITDPEGRFGERPESLSVPFDLIIPEPVPGYEFDFATVREAGDFGFLEPYYAPGGQQAAVFTYSGAEGDWLRLTQSVRGHPTLDDWLDAIGYETEGEIVTVGGVEVLVENLTREGQAWISATVITSDLFLVVDGSSGEEDVLAMVEASLRASGDFIVQGGTQQQPTPVPPPFDVQPAYEPLTPSFMREVQVGIAAVVIGAVVVGALSVGVVVFTIVRIIPRPPDRSA